MPKEAGEIEHAVATVESRRVYGVYCVGLLISCFLITLIITVIIVLLLVEGEDSAIILPVLLALLVATAIGSYIFIRWQHKKAVERRNQGAMVQTNRSQQQLSTENTEEVKSKSWAFGRRISASSSGHPMPSAPPDSSNNSQVIRGEKSCRQGPPGYEAVPTHENTT